MSGKRVGKPAGICGETKYPERIAAYPPLGDVLSERDGKPLSKEDSEMLLWMAEVRSQMSRMITPAEREFLLREERGVERYFNNRRFSHHPSTSVFASRSYEAGLSGVFIAEGSQAAPHVDGHGQLSVGLNALHMVDSLLAGREPDMWVAGVDYLVGFLKLKAALKAGAMHEDELAALCHQANWEGRGDYESLHDESARALLIHWNARAGNHSIEPVDIDREEVLHEFRLVRGGAAGLKVFERISELVIGCAIQR